MERNYGLQPPIPLSLKSVAGFVLILIIWQGGAIFWFNLVNTLIPATHSGLPQLITLYLSFSFLILGVYMIIRYFFKISFRTFLLEGKRPDFHKFAIYFA